MKFKEAQALRSQCSPIYQFSANCLQCKWATFLGSCPLPRGSLKSDWLLWEYTNWLHDLVWDISMGHSGFIASCGNARSLVWHHCSLFSLLHHIFFSHFSLRAHSSKLTVPKSLAWSLHSGKLHLFPLVHNLWIWSHRKMGQEGGIL